MGWNRSPDVKGPAERAYDAACCTTPKCLWRSPISRRLFPVSGLNKNARCAQKGLIRVKASLTGRALHRPRKQKQPSLTFPSSSRAPLSSPTPFLFPRWSTRFPLFVSTSISKGGWLFTRTNAYSAVSVAFSGIGIARISARCRSNNEHWIVRERCGRWSVDEGGGGGGLAKEVIGRNAGGGRDEKRARRAGTRRHDVSK